MKQRRRTRARLLGALPILLLLTFVPALGGCGADDEPTAATGDSAGGAPADLSFEVVPDYLGEPYRNEELGIAVRPPLGWQPLSSEQRDRVADALLTKQEEEPDRYSLELVDLFLHTDTLSFAALSRVTLHDEPVRDVDAYAEAFGETLDVDGTGDDELRARGTFRVNGLTVTQFRHMLGDRVTFTLLFSSVDETALQLDYSVPAPAYEHEGIKLESSIGTLQRPPESEEGQ
jgi:hypothetical protein